MKWHPDQTQTPDPSGHIRLRFPYVDQCELVRFSGEVEVLSSPELRHSVIGGAKKHASTASVVQPVSE